MNPRSQPVTVPSTSRGIGRVRALAWLPFMPLLLSPSACAPPSPPPTLVPSEDIRPDPEWTLRTLDGTTFTLGELRGRPVFVNLWATWCPPCIAELGSIEGLAASLGDSVAFVLASPENADVVRAFVREHGLRIDPVLEETLAPESFGMSALPHTVVLDADGRMVLSHRGAADWDTPEVRELLRGLAAPTTSIAGTAR